MSGPYLTEALTFLLILMFFSVFGSTEKLQI